MVAEPAWAQAPPASSMPVALGLRADAALLPPDPAARYGRLPNGLRYTVQQSANPKGALSIRLGFEVGSYEEADDERGAAHFIQHMAFNGTRSFPGSQLALAFAPLGVAFGPDRNASTSFSQTVYQLDLPTMRAHEADTALKWLRDVADGMVFAAPAVERERGVVQAERAARAGGFGQLRDRIEAFEDTGLRSAARLPIGTQESLAALTPQKLQSFYDRWYRPENAVLVLVGDLPLDTLEQQVRANFADWAPRGPAGVRASRAPPPPRGPDVQLQTDPRIAAVARICRHAAPDPEGDEVARLRNLLMRGVWQAALEERLNVYKSRADTPFQEVSISDELRPDSLKTCIAVTPIKGSGAAAITTVVAEVRGFGEEGPTDDEVDTAVEQIRASIRNGIDKPPRASADRARDILDRALDGMPQLTPRAGLKALDTLMDDVGPEAVKAAFARDWSGWGPLVAGTTPEPLPQAEILASIAQPPAAPLTTAAPKPPRARVSASQAKELEGHYERGRAYVAKRKADKALREFASGLAIDPDNGDILNARGNLYLVLDKADLAVADFNQALAANPKDDIVLFNRGIADKQLGHNSEALRDFNAVLRLTPGDPATLASKADTYRQLGDLLLARDFYDAAIAADPKNATAWQARGELRKELGDAAGAETDQAQARKLDPSRGKS
ncbi:insulinase family protein [Phenylobacterium sp.]|uniref:insulinase family protein n=1 Tax=Phenylobacterium sp. TaxID=1871053 RepID=UPI002E3020DA|nr:insulinase family protein [Phenylobacterium sp.]HEX4709884.1 insulinase family protein [Phenylobacterium sp.]